MTTVSTWPLGPDQIVERCAKAGFSLNDVGAHSRHVSVVALQGYLDQHHIAKTRRAITDLVAKALTIKE